MATGVLHKHQCDTCLRIFSRLEHLQRHAKTHLDSRPFGCRICRQVFARKDALRRHEQSRHGTDETEASLTRLRRACVGCASARVTCPGGLPCANCDSKQQQCVYVRRKRRQTSSQQDASSSNLLLEHSDNEANHGNSTDNLPGWIPYQTMEGHQTEDNMDVAQGKANRPHAHFADHFRVDQHVETAMNWLPFDFDSADVPLGDKFSPGSNVLHHSNGTALLPLAMAISPDHEPQESFPEHDSLASLIASMGRASQPFGSMFFSRIKPDGDQATNPVGSLYSDGAGGRTSQAERAMHLQRAQREASLLADSAGSAATPGSECAWIQALESGLHAISSPDLGRLYRIPDQIYSDVKAKVDARVPFCSSSPSFYLTSRSFPGKETLATFVRLYFDHFHPVCPFLDLPLLNMPSWGWSLCLATAAIGCRYSTFPQKDICADALSVVLRETMVHELQFSQAEFTLSYAQALLLNTLALCQSGDTSVMALGEEAISSVMNWCRRFCLFQEPEGQIEQSIQIEGDTNQMWTAWRCREMRRRTGFFAWMLDIALSLTRYAPSVLNLQSLDLLIPSDEMLWEADSALAWHQAYRPRATEPPDANDFCNEESSRLSFGGTRISPYEDLKLFEGLSQFASTACIYALFHRHWDMIRLGQSPFLVPERDRPELRSHDSALMSYPASVPSFMSWRNKACDYMDVLHWQALGNSAKAGGLEGPIFLQLHLGRLALLTPVKELFTVAEQKISRDFFVQLPHNVAWQRLNLQRSQQIVRTWAQRDRYKARLAVVHAGATFWHVRRYATNSFVQPFTVYLAAMVLYFYAKVTAAEQTPSEARNATNNRSYEGDKEVYPNLDTDLSATNASPTLPPRTSQPHPSEQRPLPSHRTSRMPTHYYIDRPVDDEMVQHFVRDDERSTTLCAEGIGDLCSSEGAKQILLEAATLLDIENVVWPIAQKYAATLRAIVASTS